MKILKGITMKNVMHGIGDIFKDPMDEKLVAMYPLQEPLPRPVVDTRLVLVPKMVLVPEQELVLEPGLVPRLFLVPKPAFVPELAIVSESAPAPELTIVPMCGMEAALMLSNEMVAQFNKKK